MESMNKCIEQWTDGTNDRITERSVDEWVANVLKTSSARFCTSSKTDTAWNHGLTIESMSKCIEQWTDGANDK